MPSKIKRLQEQLKQRLGISSGQARDWRPTSNARNNAMIEEVRRFAQEIKNLHRDLSQLDRSVEVALSTTRSTLAASLPRAFDETTLGVSPVDKENRIVGVNVRIENISVAGNEMRQRLKDEVLFPLQQWLAAYRSIKASNKKVEEVRLELDAKRRDTVVLQEKFAKLKSGEHKDTEPTGYKLQTEEDKMNRLAQRYSEVEAEVFNALLTLIRDTAVLRDYAAAALAIVQRCFTQAYTTFDMSTAVPPPMLPPPALPAPGGYYPPTSYNSTVTHSDGGAAPLMLQGPAGLYPSPLRTGHGQSMNTTMTGSGGGAVTGNLRQSQTFSGSSPATSAANVPATGIAPRAPPSPNSTHADLGNLGSLAPGVATAQTMRYGGHTVPVPSSTGPVRGVAPATGIQVPSTGGTAAPVAPTWYQEAKDNARTTGYDVNDTDSEGVPETANPFTAAEGGNTSDVKSTEASPRVSPRNIHIVNGLKGAENTTEEVNPFTATTTAI